MSVTTKTPFTNPVVQASTPPADFSWAGTLNDITVDNSNDIDCEIYSPTTGQKSRVLTLQKPKFFAEVPANAVISDITLSHRGQRTSSGGIQGRFKIGATGNEHAASLSGSLAEFSYTGTLIDWGLTNAQAMEFINGTRPLSYYITVTSIGPAVYQHNLVEVIFCQVTWGLPAPTAGQVYMPQVF